MLAAALAIQGSVADSSPFRALPLPAPGRVRGASGAPGPDYWQQRVDYVIRATLDTSSQTIRGRERIHYVNHSPDTLAFLWVQIEQNLFAPNSITYALSQPPLHFAGGAVFDFTGKGFRGGITIERFTAGGQALKRTEYGTMMRVELPRPLPPRGRAPRPSPCRSLPKRKPRRTAHSGSPAPRPGTSRRGRCATWRGPPPPISAGTRRAGTGS